MGCSKSILRGKFIAIQAYLRKQEKGQINKLTLYLKQLEREQTRPKVSRRKEIIKINETKSWFFEKIDKPLARLIKQKRERTQINTIRNEKGKEKTDITESLNKTKRQPMKWEKIFANESTDKGSISCFLCTKKTSEEVY